MISEEHIVIGRDRYITVPKALQRIAVQYDHNIETVTFDCPRFWDEHDMSKMTIYIAYMRKDRYRDKDVAENVTIDGSDPELMHFDWTVSKNATMINGPLKILVCIVQTDDDGNEVVHWNSEINNQMFVSEGMECNDYVVSLYPDIITDLLVRMDNILEANGTIIDKSLTERGLAAEAKATGNAIKNVAATLDYEISKLTSNTSQENNARKAEIAVERKRIDSLVVLPDGSTSGDAELADARITPDGVLFPTAGDAIRSQVERLSDTLDLIIVENIYDSSVQTPDTITDSAYIQTGELKNHDNYFVTGPIDVSRFAGKSLYFSKLLYGSATDAARVNCYDANGEYLTWEGLDGNRYAVPANASYIRLNVYKGDYPSIDNINGKFMILTSDIETQFFPYGYKSLLPEPSYEKLPKMAIDISGDAVNVTAASGTGFLHYVFKPFSGSKNSFFDFSSIGFTTERSAIPTDETLVFSNGSDYFGPYIVKAVNDIDGDMPDSLNFTGASHAYSGNTEGNTSATGISYLDRVLVDGKAYSEYSGYGDALDIYWVNYVQATNTKKSDGSGRVVLKENYHIHFDGDKFEVENDITAMEEIDIVRYYGLQIAQGVSGYAYKISYVGSHNNIVSDNGNSNSADNNCSEIYIRRTDLPVECRFGLYPIGLGKFYCNNAHSAFDTDYGKSYFYLINPDTGCHMVTGQQVNFKGYYKFGYYN